MDKLISFCSNENMLYTVTFYCDEVKGSFVVEGGRYDEKEDELHFGNYDSRFVISKLSRCEVRFEEDVEVFYVSNGRVEVEIYC